MKSWFTLPRFTRAALAVFFSAITASLAHADTFNETGTFTGDDSVFVLDFSTTTSQSYSFATTSYASGGFVPVLTLFNANGLALDNSGPGTSDASLTDTLGSGSYFLTLSEFPNFVANGTSVDPTNIPAGFQFYGDPTITGDSCSAPGSSFYDTITCTPRTSAYAITGSSTPAVAATPEPSSWLLVLPPAVALAWYSRRRQLASL